jgi:hypothetical protein
VDFVERVFFAAIKRATGAREQVGHTQADDYGHKRGDELETAHQILSVLHGESSHKDHSERSRGCNAALAFNPVAKPIVDFTGSFDCA